ncbi:MAG: alpha-hydroxy-acid oxidizing protein, partial [Pseudomonadota bacterium]
MKSDPNILRRKTDHIDSVLSLGTKREGHSPFDDIQLTHNALPEFNLATMPLNTEFLGKALKLPFLISSMTGGPLKAERINLNLAEAAQELGIAMGVGSQRVALLDQGARGLTAEIRAIAPDIPLYA